MEFDGGRRDDRAFEAQVDLSELAPGVVVGVAVGHRDQPRHLGQGFADEHARDDGVAREVAGEKRFVAGDVPDAVALLAGVQRVDAVDEAESLAVGELGVARCKIDWSPFSSPPSTWDDDRDPTEDDEEVFRHEKVVFVEADYTGGRAGTRQKLSNLGYSEDAPLGAVVRDFQHDYGLDDNGDPDDPIMLAKLATVHTSLAPNPLDPSEERGPDDEPYDP